MRMPPRLRTFALTAHVASSVGWLGAAAAFLALAVVGLTSPDGQMVRAAYLALEPIAQFAVLPLALAALLTGVVQSLGTDWGLFRHYWVVIKLMMTVLALGVLLQQLQPISLLADVAADAPLSDAGPRQARMALVAHAGGGILVLLVPTVLSLLKPRGMTRYGRRQAASARKASRGPMPGSASP